MTCPDCDGAAEFHLHRERTGVGLVGPSATACPNVSSAARLHHRHNPGPHRLGQTRPGVDDGGQLRGQMTSVGGANAGQPQGICPVSLDRFFTWGPSRTVLTTVPIALYDPSLPAFTLHSPPEPAFTIATIPARIASGSSGQTLMRIARAGSIGDNAPDCAPPDSGITFFADVFEGCSNPGRVDRFGYTTGFKNSCMSQSA